MKAKFITKSRKIKNFKNWLEKKMDVEWDMRELREISHSQIDQFIDLVKHYLRQAQAIPSCIGKDKEGDLFLSFVEYGDYKHQYPWHIWFGDKVRVGLQKGFFIGASEMLEENRF